SNAIGFPHRGTESRRNGYKGIVAAGQKMKAIDLLETVHVNDTERDRLRIAASAVECQDGSSFDGPAIRQAREWVSECETRNTGMPPLKPVDGPFQLARVFAEVGRAE